MTPRAKLISLAGLTAALAFACWLAGLLAFVRDTAALVQPDLRQKKDVIVVLTGGSNRLDAGFDLMEKGLGRKLFISGVYRGLDVKKLLKRWKDAPQSLLDCCVVLGFEADNTAGNAAETVKWLHQQNYRSLYLVTANYHIKRALLEFRDAAPDLDITPYPVAPDGIYLANWWKNEASRNVILREYMKYATIRVLKAIK